MQDLTPRPWTFAPQGDGPAGSRRVPSKRPARVHGLSDGPAGAGGGAVSRRNCSIAAAIAAASSGEADWRSSMRGRAGRCLPLRVTGWIA